VRVYNNLATVPTAATPADREVSVPCGNWSFVHTFTATKPAAADNALRLRAFLDPTDVLDESDEADNQLGPQLLTVQNTAPAFITTPPTAATQGVTLTHDVQVSDQNVVDRARMTIALI